MENIELVIDKDGIEHIIIDRGNGEYTSMPKATYDEQQAQAEQFTPNLSPTE